MNDEDSQSALSAISHHAAQCSQTIWDHAIQPSALYRPKLSIDGDQWCALYGEDLQCGIAGFGASPELAMLDFNKQFTKKIAA